MKTDLKTLTIDTELALNEFATSGSSSQLLQRLGLSRQQALDAADMDEEVESCREELRAAMISAPWRIVGDVEQETQDKLFSVIRRIMPVLAESVLTAKTCGYSVCEYLWASDGGMWIVNKVIDRRGNLDDYEPLSNGALSWKAQQGQILDTDLKYLFLTNRATSAEPMGEPMVARLFPAIMLRRHGLKFAVQFIKRYAQPYLVGKTIGDKNDFADNLYQFNAGGATVVGVDDDVSLLKLDADGSAFKRMEQLANARIQKILLGKVKTSDLETGSRAAQETEENSRNDRIMAYLALLTQACQHVIDATLTVNRQYATEIAPVGSVIFEFEKSAPIDLNRAQRDKIYFDTGIIKPTKDYITQVLGFEDNHFTLENEHSFQLSDKDAIHTQTNAIQAVFNPHLNKVFSLLNQCKSLKEFQAALNALDLSDEDQNIINQTFIGDLAAMMKGV